MTRVQVQRFLDLIDRTMPKLRAANERLAASSGQAEYDEAKGRLLAAVMDAVSEIPSAVDSDAALRITSHVRDRVKKNTRIISTLIPGKAQ